jgi:integrase/recombinase XerC
MSEPVAPADALVQRYLVHVRVEKRLAGRTLSLYTEDLRKLGVLADQAGLGLLQVQPAHVRHWAARMHSQGRSPRGIALILSGWRGFYRWAGRQGLIETNPVDDVRAPKAARPLPKALGLEDAQRLADADLAQNPWLEARDAAMVELLYGSGLRVGELLMLDLVGGDAAYRAGRGWVDAQAAQVHVLGKGGKRRAVPVGPQALQALAHWQAVRGVWPETALFIGRHGTRLTAQSVWQRLRGRGRLAGLATPVHPHVLRHSFASHVLQSSQDLRAVQELLGHASIASTQVYTRLDFQHLAQVYDAAHPRARRKS